jgi:hypothetical protein
MNLLKNEDWIGICWEQEGEKERPNRSWKIFLEEAVKCGKTWSEARRLAAKQSNRDASQISYST